MSSVASADASLLRKHGLNPCYLHFLHFSVFLFASPPHRHLNPRPLPKRLSGSCTNCVVCVGSNAPAEMSTASDDCN